MTSALTHIALQVRDLRAAIAFYSEFCGMMPAHLRDEGKDRVAWMAEPGHEKSFVIVLIEGGAPTRQGKHDYGHLGFAVGSRAEVDEIACRAGSRLAWPPTEQPYPVGYYCGVRDPDGHVVEFSFGQPLGPGAS